MKKSIRGIFVAALGAASLLGSQVATAHEAYDRYDRGQERHARFGHDEHSGHRAYGRPVMERRVVVEQPRHVERRSGDNGNIAAGLVLGGILGAIIASQMGGDIDCDKGDGASRLVAHCSVF